MRPDRLLARVRPDSTRERYVQHPIYVSFRLAYYFRKLAARDGLRLGDLGRILVFLGFTIRVILWGRELQERKGLEAAVRELEELTRGRVKRAYALSKGSRGVWLNVRFPRDFLGSVDRYAKATGQSSNDALAHFLQDGLYLYLTGRKRLLKATQPQTGV